MEQRRPRALPLRDRPAGLPAGGTYVVPAIIELDRARELKEEVFGPVLHVVRWRAEELDALLDDIAANGTALTLGVHSRIDLTVAHVAARLAARQRLCQSQHDRRRGRHPAVRRHRICLEPDPRPAARTISAALPPSRSSPSIPPLPAAMPALLAQDD